jgi:hypothetical protein
MMCDSGINDTLDRIRDVLAELITDGAIDANQENIPMEVIDYHIADYVINHLDEDGPMEDIVKDIDNYMVTVRDEAYESGAENSCQDCVPYEEYSEMEDERDELQKKVDKLEKRLQYPTIKIHDEIFAWIPDKQKFVSKMGRVYEIRESDDPTVSGWLFDPDVHDLDD